MGQPNSRKDADAGLPNPWGATLRMYIAYVSNDKALPDMKLRRQTLQAWTRDELDPHPALKLLFTKSRKASQDLVEGVQQIRRNVHIRFLDPPSEEMTQLVLGKVVYEGKNTSRQHLPLHIHCI